MSELLHRLGILFSFLFITSILSLTLAAEEHSDFRGGFEVPSSVVDTMRNTGALEYAKMSGAVSRSIAPDEKPLTIEVPYPGGKVAITLTSNLSSILSRSHPARRSAHAGKGLSSIATFQGRVHSDNPGDYARLTMYPGPDGVIIEGTMVVNGKMYGIEPISSYFNLPRAMLGEAEDGSMGLIVSNVSDEQQKMIIGSCAARVADDKKAAHFRSLISAGSPVVARDGGTPAIEVAAVGDFEWFEKNGSSASAAEGKIISIINSADGHYRRELGYGISVKATKIFSSPNDPYSGTNPNSMLKQFSSNKGGIDGHHAHLFTGRFLGGNEGGTVGVAWRAMLCSPAHNTGISQWLSGGSVKVLTTLFMHELGHNAGSKHVNGSGVMHPGLNSSNPSTSFSNKARNQILSYVNGSGGSCVTGGTPGGGGLPPLIRKHPKSIATNEGKKGTLKVLASISAILKSKKGLQYQWFKNNASIAGATKNVLKLGQLTTTMAGDYHVVVTNPSGKTTQSSTASVQVSKAITTTFVNFRPNKMRKAKIAGNKFKGVCLAKIRPASSRKILLANAQFEFRIGGNIVATQSGKSGKKYVHILDLSDNNKEFTCTFIDSDGIRHDASNATVLLVE